MIDCFIVQWLDSSRSIFFQLRMGETLPGFALSVAPGNMKPINP
ncbi:hypothetical protein M23134_02668 [Microscilla marina ATCC 23134]|uniref:Uncharacterized protein n=1 Tax=Microscilla marina ATCC 23134 TaxID=313606 RepID=A1ZNW0_MICM2|nr:hypothetical protein M23134_02668 [Microscilla marina ATCC 23134]